MSDRDERETPMSDMEGVWAVIDGDDHDCDPPESPNTEEAPHE